MRIITFACSTLLALLYLSPKALGNPAKTSQNNSDFLRIQKDSNLADNSTITEDSSREANPNTNDINDVRFKLENLRQGEFTPRRGAPSLTIANPYGFGVDSGFYSGLSYQNDTRGGLSGVDDADGTWGIGLGLGDAQKSLGAELGYSFASFGQNGRDFGSGGFNAKLHRRFADDWSVAAGWNSFLSIGDENDLEDSMYLATTKIFRTRQNVNSAFSRLGATVGVGNGQFRSVDDINDDNESFNVFGSMALRVARPLSFITEWTGQDLAMGISAAPFRTIPVTLNLGLRDIAGAGDGARLIFGLGSAL